MMSAAGITLRKPLGQILVESRKASAEDVERATKLQERNPARLGKLLVELGSIAERDLLEALGEQLGIARIDSAQFPPVPPEVTTISPRFMRTAKFFPFEVRDGELLVAIADPLDHETLESIRLATGCKVLPHLCSETDILDAIEKFYGAGGDTLSRLVASFDLSATSDVLAVEDVEHLRDLALEAPVIRLVNLLISRAVSSRASDIHVEPLENELRVRYRIDGFLYPVESPPRQMTAAVISRIKLMAKLNIAERRLPQDGRIRLKVLGKDIDIRVSTLPTIYGESVVLRILDRSGTSLLALTELGFSTANLTRMRRLTAQPHGIFLVTGPTGSGKTTTLYAALSQINQTDKKIITLEDPVEYQIAGVNQMQVNPLIGLTFAAGLRHIVRQDPDVIMVGEIRDLETAEIAIRAALTGHLVFSTLHTNDAPSSITRLVDMGAANYLLSSAILGVLAQRLVRVLCSRCKTPSDTHPSYAPPDGQSVTSKTFRAVGCAECAQTGFRGRIGIFELMELDNELQRHIVRNADANVLRQAAVQSGMRTLREDGWEKVLAGVTTPEEVFRVTQEAI